MDTVRTGIERAALPKRVACSDFAAPAAMSFHRSRSIRRRGGVRELGYERARSSPAVAAWARNPISRRGFAVSTD